LAIARHETFDAYPIYARRLFAQGSRDSVSTLKRAILELRRLKEPVNTVNSLIRELQGIANGFGSLARAAGKSTRGGEAVSRADYTKYDVLSGGAVHACRLRIRS
jgi:hypothetical protein